jgi:hypothetical protein
MFRAASDGARTPPDAYHSHNGGVAMGTVDDTSAELSSNPEQMLKHAIETQRARLLQVHAVMICLREVLLYAEGEDAVIYAEAANAAAQLANNAAEDLDSVRLEPVFRALRIERAYRPTAERGLSPDEDDGHAVREPRAQYAW